MKRIVVSSLSLLLLLGSCKQKVEEPNVLIIMCDQLNIEALSCYGGAVSTPHIDRLAAEGILFRNGVCNYPVCSPSRGSFYLGQYPHEHGIIHNAMNIDYPSVDVPETEEAITNADPTFVKFMNQKGYSTHHYGKWHLTQEKVNYFPDEYGEHLEYAVEMKEVFDVVKKQPRETWMNWYDWILPTVRSEKYEKAIELTDEAFKERTYSEFVRKMGRLELPVEQNFDVRVADHAVKTISQSDDTPFCVVASFNYPHDPNVVPLEYYEMFDPDKIKLPDNHLIYEEMFEDSWSRTIVKNIGDDGVKEFLRIYYGSVKLLDDQVGRILSALEKTGKRENTIVVFTADHGDMMGEHGMVWKSNSSFYNGVMKVPFIISYPKRIKPMVTDVPISLVDFAPTIMSLTNQPVPESMTGKDYSKWLLNPIEENIPQEYVLCQRMHANKDRLRLEIGEDEMVGLALMDADWKYIRYKSGQEFLYHLSADPEEEVDLFNDPQFEGSLQEMREAMAEKLEEVGFY